MAELIEKTDLSRLIETDFVACMHGKILQARRIFENVLEFKDNLIPAKIGLAFTYLVVDDFLKGDELLGECPQDDDDVKAMQVFSLVLQRQADRANARYDTIVDKQCPSAILAKNCLSLAER